MIQLWWDKKEGKKSTPPTPQPTTQTPERLSPSHYVICCTDLLHFFLLFFSILLLCKLFASCFENGIFAEFCFVLFLHHFVVDVVCRCLKSMENSPIRAMGTPHCKIWTVVSTASCTPGKDTTADRVCNHTSSHRCTLELHKNLGNHSSTDHCTPPSTLLRFQSRTVPQSPWKTTLLSQPNKQLQNRKVSTLHDHTHAKIHSQTLGFHTVGWWPLW